MQKAVKILWDWGTGYDLFFSLYVIHRPVQFGLRGPWAAGVRSRLSQAERSILEDSQHVVRFPLPWIYRLNEPKDGVKILSELRKAHPKDRLPELVFSMDLDPKVRQILEEVSIKGSWAKSDQEEIQSVLKGKLWSDIDLACTLEWWSRPEEFGERYLAALQSYYEVFFAEEERRIAPILKSALEQAQERAADLEWTALLEELSQGVRFASLPDFSELVLVPSYWSTPLIVYEEFGEDQFIFMFGARPADLSLVPGEVVPDTLLRGLKAMADPTRLRIIRYLANESLTPTQLARQLRLRPPTVLHHLSVLRLASLVKLTVEGEGEKRYAIRTETIAGTFAALERFLEVEDEARS
jgi:DNA-binding transcriptional ArsR family regulator